MAGPNQQQITKSATLSGLLKIGVGAAVRVGSDVDGRLLAASRCIHPYAG
jgi:hypothetical protein